MSPQSASAAPPGDRRQAMTRLTMEDAHVPGAAVHQYKETPTRALRIHVLDGRADASSPGGAVVLFHGGGWSAGSPMFLNPHARALMGLGLVVVLPEYRVGMRDETGIPECSDDAHDAVAYVREHAADLGIDPARIALAGSSAGAHLALLVAGTTPDAAAAVVGWSTPCDLGAVRPGGTLTDEDRGRLSPMTYAGGSYPPVLLLHGDADAIVPVDGARRFAAARKAAGGDVELVEFPGGPHAFERGEANGEPLLPKTIEMAAALFARTGVLVPAAGA